jgi:glutamate carboxypeptidase
LPRNNAIVSIRAVSSPEKLPQMGAFLRAREAAMAGLLKRFVGCESPTDAKAAVDRFGRMVATEWRKRGAQIQVLRQKHAGNHLRVTWPASRPGQNNRRQSKQILVLGHLDTVYEIGTILKMPFRLRRGRAFGPGVFDMKGGLVIALFAVDAMAHARRLPHRRVVFLWTSDEETGSQSSRRWIEREARRSSAVLVLEPAQGREGMLKTRRKAIGTAEVVITGRAAHAGLNPEAGVNAVHELALQAARLMRLNNPRRGITVNPTMAQGGTRSNVIPAEARLTIDLRAETLADVRRIEAKLKTFRPILRGAQVSVRGGFSRPPLERRASAALFSHARQIAQQLGFSLGEHLAGGGSDGNFTAALGVPTLDGLGAVGEGAHSPDEQVIVSALPQRAALLAALLATL